MAIVLGKDIKIYSGATGTTPIIAGAKSCSISKTCDTFETASATSPTAREYLPGRTDWEVSISQLVTTGAPFDAIMKVHGTYTISVVINGTRKTGTAICVSADASGAIGTLATGSVKLKGSGELA